MKKVKTALKNVRNKKDHGPDFIPIDNIKHSRENDKVVDR